MYKGMWQLTVHGVTKELNNLATEHQQHLTMRLVLFSFSRLGTEAWKDDVTCSYSQEELELESRQSGHRIHNHSYKTPSPASCHNRTPHPPAS